MVLINELTVEQINAALLHLQRSKDEVVGGNKGTTIQNITISNSGGGGGNNVDYSGTIKNLANLINKNTSAIEKNAGDIAKLKSDFSNIEKSVEDTLEGLVDNGISDLSFDPLTKQLTITTNDGDIYQAIIEQDIGYLSYDSATNKLILTTGNQSQEITLPYILSSEKGSANGVATLDENGRVPYSQLPESAMEFLGQWNASTNTPHLADGTGTNGDFYIVSAGGTVNLGTAQDPHIVTFSINDRIVYEGDIAQWVRLPAGQVSSVNGQSGEVTLTASDIEYSTGVSIKAKIDANAVQADWNVSDTTSLAYIKNKPTIPASPVQSDWNVTDTTSLAYIKNKPSVAVLGNTAGCGLGTASAGSLTTAARSDHVHPVPAYLINYDSNTPYCAFMACGNTLNITPAGNNSWINFTGGSTYTTIGNGAGGRGTLIAACFCGTATSSNYLSTYVANGSDNISSLKAIFNTAPKSVGTAVRLQHSTHSMAFGWFLDGYACADAYGGWFVSDYDIPRFVGIRNGAWKECTIITSDTIGSQHVACAKCVYLDSFTTNADRPVMVACPRGTTGYSDQGVSTCCCFTFNPYTGVLRVNYLSGTADNANHVCRRQTGNTNNNYSVLLGYSNTASGGTEVYASNRCPLTFNPSTGVLTATCFQGDMSVSRADKVYYTALAGGDDTYPLVFIHPIAGCNYVSLESVNNFYFKNCSDCLNKSYFHFHAQIASSWRILPTPTFTCNQGSDTGTDWFLGCARIDGVHQIGSVEVWNCTNLAHGKEKKFSITLEEQVFPIKTAMFTYMYDSCGNYGGPELSAFAVGTCKICFGVYNRNNSANLCRPHFLLQWWY